MNGLNTRAELNILPLGSYDCLIGMNWLDQHHVILDCHNKEFTCLDEEENLRKVQGIPKAVTIREISASQRKKCYRKGCKIFAAHMEETPKDKVPNLEYHAVLEDFEDVFKEVPGLPPKRYIDFSINLMPGAAPVSKTPYRMSTPEKKKNCPRKKKLIATPENVFLLFVEHTVTYPASLAHLSPSLKLRIK
jgi:hypothetical protein